MMDNYYLRTENYSILTEEELHDAFFLKDNNIRHSGNKHSEMTDYENFQRWLSVHACEEYALYLPEFVHFSAMNYKCEADRFDDSDWWLGLKTLGYMKMLMNKGFHGIDSDDKEEYDNAVNSKWTITYQIGKEKATVEIPFYADTWNAMDDAVEALMDATIQ